MSYITEDFLLHTKTAQRLFHGYAEDQPILDYHCHISPKEIAEDRRFSDLHAIWLEGDHYKWRVMRADGVPEKFCTGDASPYDKFKAWAHTVPNLLRNPLYQWSHFELLRYFDISDLLNAHSAGSIWKRANQRLTEGDLSAHEILKKFNVRVVCTTDDPVDPLDHHKKIAASGLATRVYPSFRPDRALRTSDPVAYNQWLDALGEAAGVSIDSL